MAGTVVTFPSLVSPSPGEFLELIKSLPDERQILEFFVVAFEFPLGPQ